jgi:putative ABC transport system substrate-binding protein
LFIPSLGGVAFSLSVLAGPLVADAQPPGKVPRIGVLAAGIPATYTSRYEAFRDGLSELGYVDGQTITIEYRYADGKLERLSDLAAELVRLNVDLIVASSAPETAAAKRATTSIPIVFARHSDAVGAGHLVSLARPGGNVTGVSAFGPELAAKRVEVLKEAFPRIVRVAVLWNAANPTKLLDWQETQAAARALGLTLQGYEVRRPEDFAGAFAAMTKQRPDALLTLPDPLLLNSRASIVAFAAKERLPAIYGPREYVEAGGLMTYDSSVAETYRRAAGYVGRILKGAKPSELAVTQPTSFELLINLKTARALSFTIPQSILRRADEVFE